MPSEQDWYRSMTSRQAEIVKDFVKKGWKITGINETRKIMLIIVDSDGLERTARIPR